MALDAAELQSIRIKSVRDLLQVGDARVVPLSQQFNRLAQTITCSSLALVGLFAITYIWGWHDGIENRLPIG